MAKIHHRGPQDRWEHQPAYYGHAGLENHVHAASSTAGEHLVTNMLEPEASPDRHDCQLTYCEAWNQMECHCSLGHNATDEVHMAKIHQGGNPLGLENHLYAASSTAGGKFACSALGRNPNAWSHQGLHGAQSQIWMHCLKLWNKYQSATHGFGVQVHHYGAWNYEHRNT